MKRAVLGLAMAGVGLCLQSQASATLIAYEGFDYAGGAALAGQNGGTGFVAAWTASSTNGTQTTEAPGMTGSLSSTGNRLVLTGINANNTSNGGRQILSANRSTGTIYVTAVMRPDANNANSIGYLQLNDVNSNTPVRIGYSAGSYWYIGSPYNGNARTNSTIAPAVGTSATLLARVNFDTNVADLWVNPTATLGLPDASVDMGTSSYIRFDRMSLRTSSSSSGTTTTSFDEIRIGSELNDVLLVPEPVAISMVGIAGCILAMRRRTRQ